MDIKKEIIYGKWESPISVKLIANNKKISDLIWNSYDSSLVWCESFDKKNKIFSYSIKDDKVTRIKNIRKASGSIGYGGGGLGENEGTLLILDSSRLYKYDSRKKTKKKVLTKGNSIASPKLSPSGDWVAYVSRSEDEDDCLGVVDAEGKLWPQKFLEGFDFYAQPRWSKDGKTFSFISWNHPHMPWQNSALYLADVDYSEPFPKLINVKKITDDTEQAVFQSEFSKDGKRLYFMSDKSGWSQLYSFEFSSQKIEKISDINGECAQPNWVQEMRTWCLSSDGEEAFIVATKNCKMQIHRINLKTKVSEVISKLKIWTDIYQICSASGDSYFSFVGSAPKLESEVVIYNYKKDEYKIISTHPNKPLLDEDLSEPRFLTWNTKGGDIVSGLYWEPKNSTQKGVKDTAPPVIVMAHVGPTSQYRVTWDLETQFFTSRGIGVLCVNFRGSTGFGREYMEKLNGNYGIYDVEDLVTGLEYLSDLGEVDRKKAVVMGSSSGGYTVFQTMATCPDVFAGGISSYGITDLLDLAENTHKFEKYYNDILIATMPEGKSILKARSPFYSAGKIKKPIAIFQGSDDPVVDQSQADKIVKILQENDIPHVYHLYEGEGHGFRKIETNEHFYQEVLSFIEQLV